MPKEIIDLDEGFEEFLEELEDYVKNPSKYNNYEMPDFTKPFTEEEKQGFIDQYTNATQVFNKELPDEMKIEFDPDGFRKKINDPEQAEMYRRTIFVNEQKDKKHELNEKYKREFAKQIEFAKKKTNKELPLDRVMQMLLKVDGSEASDNFNRKLLNFYYNHPNEVAQAVLKGIIKADSTVYQGILKDDYERCKVYTDNFVRSYIAYEAQHVLDVMEKDGDLTKEIKKNPMISFLQAQQSLGSGFGSADMFAMPKMTIEQLGLLSVQSNPEKAKYMNIVAKNGFDSTFDTVKEEIKLLNKTGVLDDKEPALTYKAIETKDGKVKEIKLLDAIQSKDSNVTIVKRSEEEKQNMLYITNGIKLRYEVVRRFKEDFVSSYNDRNPQTKIDKFSQSKILDSHKGGFFERLFNTTSKEYKDFVENFKKFTDPNNHDISVKDKLIESAKAYINHKNIDNVVDLANFDDATGKERINLCLSVLDSLNVKLGSYKLIEDNPVAEEKKDNIVRVQVDGLEKDTDIEKTDTTKENNKVAAKNKTIQVEVEKVK